MRYFFILFLLLCSTFLSAQVLDDSSDILERQYQVDAMKTRALDALSRGDFSEALELLDTAIALAPQDPLLQNMKVSARELQIISEDVTVPTVLDTDQPIFYTLSPRAVNPVDEDAIESPDFVEELVESRQLTSFEEYRDALTISIGGQWEESRSIYLEDDVLYQDDSIESVTQAFNLFGDLQYYFESVDRALGVNARYYGNIYNPEDGDILFHQMDLGIMMRGFFQESVDARSSLGFRFGVGLLFLNEYIDSEKDLVSANALTFGVFYSDAIFRHIFRKSDFFRKLMFDIGVDYYYLTQSEYSYMIRSNGVLAYQFSPGFRLGVSGRLVSTAQDIQVLSAWSMGLQLSYSH